METILLIYNDEYFAKTIQEFLGAQGYDVKIVRDADLAEQSAGQQQPQVIVLDALLQKTNGFELCQAFKANPALKEIPTIMTSALYISDEERQTGIHFGAGTSPIVANRCLMKPFKPLETITIAAYLASNLAQYGLQGHYPQHEAATPADPLHKPCMVVSVKDQGIGIDRKNFTILFNEFRQLDGSLTREYGSTGLGLAISKKLIELHGGKIWLESQVGVGTTFYFSLPLS
jgi:DNA-binding response OmpR family regulator